MAKPCTPHPIPQAEQLFKIETANVLRKTLAVEQKQQGSRWMGEFIPPLGL
mgnify:CR=1 FL=1